MKPIAPSVVNNRNSIWGVQIEFTCRKIQITCSKIKIWLIEETLTTIFYRCYWYILLVIGSILFLKVSILNLFIYAKEILRPSSERLTEEKAESYQGPVIIYQLGRWGCSDPSPPSFSLIFLIFDGPFPPVPKRKICICWCPNTIKFFAAINAHRHTNALRLIQIETEMEWSQFWGWASQQAYVTKAQWTRILTRIMATEKHPKFRCMYVSEISFSLFPWKMCGGGGGAAVVSITNRLILGGGIVFEIQIGQGMGSPKKSKKWPIYQKNCPAHTHPRPAQADK